MQHMEHRQGEEEPEGATDAGFWDRWSADLTIEWVSAYYYRGLLVERHGFILQPSFEVAYDLTAPESDLGVWVWGEMWNSLQSSATDANTSDWLRTGTRSTGMSAWRSSTTRVGELRLVRSVTRRRCTAVSTG